VSNTCLVRRAEERILLTVPRPTGLIKVTNVVSGYKVAEGWIVEAASRPRRSRRTDQGAKPA
jgi:hypothetical protein